MTEMTNYPDLFRDGGKLLRGLVYVPRSNKKPASIRVLLASANKALGVKAKETMFTLEAKSFAEQYRRAVNALADFHAVPVDDPVRDVLAATATAFLQHYGLQTRTVTITYDEVITD